jgi:pyruvate formate lyase activating enzyme
MMNRLPKKPDFKENGQYDREKSVPGIIFDIKRYAIHDGPGIRTTIFLKGCPLRCCWCHNPEGLRPGIEKTMAYGDENFPKQVRVVGENRTVQSVMDEITRDVLFFDESGGGVTFSGGEPLLQPEFLRALLFHCQKSGIHTAVDTSGYATYDIIDRIIDMVDLFLYDVKFVDPGLHKKYTGKDNRLILSNLKEIDRLSRSTIIRFPVVPGITDTKKNVTQVSQFLSTLKNTREIAFLPYHNLAANKYQRLNIENRMKPTSELFPEQSLAGITRHFESLGFRVNRGGNHE